ILQYSGLEGSACSGLSNCPRLFAQEAFLPSKCYIFQHATKSVFSRIELFWAIKTNRCSKYSKVTIGMDSFAFVAWVHFKRFESDVTNFAIINFVSISLSDFYPLLFMFSYLYLHLGLL
ncbi:MAG: hypothetical protein ACOYOA_05825, partial [Saprospiraceae bacterium]